MFCLHSNLSDTYINHVVVHLMRKASSKCCDSYPGDRFALRVGYRESKRNNTHNLSGFIKMLYTSVFCQLILWPVYSHNPMRWVNRLLSNNNDMKSQAAQRHWSQSHFR